MARTLTRYRHYQGRHKFVCDVDGMEYPSEFKRVRWDGAVVHVDNLDPRHPLDFLPTPRDNPVIQDPQKEGVLNIPEEFDYAIFALIDGDGNPIVDDEGVQFRVPQTAASF